MGFTVEEDRGGVRETSNIGEVFIIFTSTDLEHWYGKFVRNLV
jgi:hypothetical protein